MRAPYPSSLTDAQWAQGPTPPSRLWPAAAAGAGRLGSSSTPCSTSSARDASGASSRATSRPGRRSTTIAGGGMGGGSCTGSMRPAPQGRSPPARPGARRLGRDHGQPKRAHDPGRRCAGLRRRQARAGAQAAPPGRHRGAHAGAGRERRRCLRPGRSAAPALGAASAPAPPGAILGRWRVCRASSVIVGCRTRYPDRGRPARRGSARLRRPATPLGRRAHLRLARPLARIKRHSELARRIASHETLPDAAIAAPWSLRAAEAGRRAAERWRGGSAWRHEPRWRRRRGSGTR